MLNSSFIADIYLNMKPMQIIKILGTGCPNCKRTEAVLKSAIEELNIDATIEKVEDIQDIMLYDVMRTPAIVINEMVVLKGHVPTIEEVKETLIKSNCCSDV